MMLMDDDVSLFIKICLKSRFRPLTQPNLRLAKISSSSRLFWFSLFTSSEANEVDILFFPSPTWLKKFWSDKMCSGWNQKQLKMIWGMFLVDTRKQSQSKTIDFLIDLNLYRKREWCCFLKITQAQFRRFFDIKPQIIFFTAQLYF